MIIPLIALMLTVSPNGLPRIPEIPAIPQAMSLPAQFVHLPAGERLGSFMTVPGLVVPSSASLPLTGGRSGQANTSSAP